MCTINNLVEVSVIDYHKKYSYVCNIRKFISKPYYYISLLDRYIRSEMLGTQKMGETNRNKNFLACNLENIETSMENLLHAL